MKKRYFLTLLIITLLFSFYGFNSIKENNEGNNKTDDLGDCIKSSNDPNFGLEWSRTNMWGKTCLDIAVSSSEDIYMVGGSDLMKYDKNGNLEWRENLNGDYERLILLTLLLLTP
jgi:hypothetical protein